MKDTILIVIIAVLVAGGGGFFAGSKYQSQQRKGGWPTTTTNQGQLRPGENRKGGWGEGQGQGNRIGFRPVKGEIIGTDEKSITVKMDDGSSKIILISDTTQIYQAETASREDLTEGTTVSVFGTTNTDGSVSAQNIELNPIKRNIPNLPEGETQGL